VYVARNFVSIQTTRPVEAIDQINYEDALWAAHGMTAYDLYNSALWASADLNNRLQNPSLGFTVEEAEALLKVIDAVGDLVELKGRDGLHSLALPAHLFEQEAAQ
jgi:hypothetical protein